MINYNNFFLFLNKYLFLLLITFFFIYSFDYSNFINLSTSFNYQIFFQDYNTSIMEGIIDLHNDIWVFLIIILVFVFYVFFIILVQVYNYKKLFQFKKYYKTKIVNFYNYNFINSNKYKPISHNLNLEIIWTLIPTFILFFIAFPSFILLYSLDEVINPLFSLKIIGNQWYWSYEYFDNFNFIEDLEIFQEQDIGVTHLIEDFGVLKNRPLTQDHYEMFEEYSEASEKYFNPTKYPEFINLLDESNNFANFDDFTLNTLSIVKDQMFTSYYAFLLQDNKFNIINNFNIIFDSYLINDINLLSDEKSFVAFRLLEVDNKIYLPFKTHIRLTITSKDVLHCWTLPAVGVKLDACPGRLNQTSLFLLRRSVMYGQCSELCGINHGFMPIVLSVCTFDQMKNIIFIEFLNKIFNLTNLKIFN